MEHANNKPTQISGLMVTGVLLLLFYIVSILLSGAKPVFLLTDIAVFVLIIGVAALIRYSSKKEHLRDSWL
ncbi:MAG: hypothetical protein OEX00_01765, partial [Gammaproteobacteria bacterium]|nr:hypothetical protein [Gammaproteobacteria bacterium]